MATVVAKLALKGLKGVRVWPVSENTEEKYAVGTMIPLKSAQSLTKEVSKEDYTIYADDGIYDTGADYKYEDLTFTVAELPLDLEAKLSGGDYDEDTKTYMFKNIDTAPEYAFGYASRTLGNSYRMFIHYAVKLMNVKVEHKTKGDGNEIQAYELTFRNTQRNYDGAIRIEKDSEDNTYSWLNTIDNLPNP